MHRNFAAIAAVAVGLAPGMAGPAAGQATLPVERIRLPDGFRVEVVARIPAARAMAWGGAGTLCPWAS